MSNKLNPCTKRSVRHGKDSINLLWFLSDVKKILQFKLNFMSKLYYSHAKQLLLNQQFLIKIFLNQGQSQTLFQVQVSAKFLNLTKRINISLIFDDERK